MQRHGNVMVGEDVAEQMRLDLDLERTAIERLNAAITTCTAEGDNGTRELLEEILEGEEAHADWLETQLSVIEEIGIAHYLAQQLRD
jgi:bacterioferritin